MASPRVRGYVESLLLDVDANVLRGGRVAVAHDLTPRARDITFALLRADVTVRQAIAAYRALMRSHREEQARGARCRELVFSFVDLNAAGVHPLFFNPGHSVASIAEADRAYRACHGPDAPGVLFAVQPVPCEAVLVLHGEQHGSARIPFVNDDFRRRFLHALLGHPLRCGGCGAMVDESKSCFECGASVCLGCHDKNRSQGRRCHGCNADQRPPPPLVGGAFAAVISA